MPEKPKKSKEQVFREALEDISRYVLPTYSKDGGKYVPLENALYLKQMAREALGE